MIGEATLDPGASPFVPCTEEDQLLDDPPPEDIPISTQETTPAVVAAPTTPHPRPDPPDVPLPTDPGPDPSGDVQALVVEDADNYHGSCKPCALNRKSNNVFRSCDLPSRSPYL